MTDLFIFEGLLYFDNYVQLTSLAWSLLQQFFDGYGYHGTSFEQTYRCYPASFIEKVSFFLCSISSDEMCASCKKMFCS